MMKNALSSAPTSIDEKFEAAKRRTNTLREVPVEKPRPQGWKLKARPMGGLKPHGVRISGKKEF